MRKGTRIVITVGTSAAVASCGAGLYAPSAGELAKSISSMTTVTAATLDAFPETARGAMMDDPVMPSADRLLCRPVRYVTYNSVLNQEVQAISAGLSELSGQGPDDIPGLVGALFTPYAIESSAADNIHGHSGDRAAFDTPHERAGAAADSAARVCSDDLAVDALRLARIAYLNPLGRRESHSAAAVIGAGITLWQLLEPILSGGLAFIDQQRRAAAIRRYLQDENNQTRLRSAIADLEALVENQQRYRRRVAAAAFARTYAEASANGFTSEERGALLEAASLYDEISQGSANAAFAAVRGALERIIRVAQGRPQPQDFAEALRQLAASVRSFHKIAEQWESLEEGGENRKKWRDALHRLGLASPPAPAEGSE